MTLITDNYLLPTKPPVNKIYIFVAYINRGEQDSAKNMYFTALYGMAWMRVNVEGLMMNRNGDLLRR